MHTQNQSRSLKIVIVKLSHTVHRTLPTFSYCERMQIKQPIMVKLEKGHLGKCRKTMSARYPSLMTKYT